MLVYGDHAERADARSRLTALAGRIGAGPQTHDQLTSLFVELAGIAQGVADADYQIHDEDRRRPAEQLLLRQLTSLGEALLHSWEDSCSGVASLPALELPLDLPGEIEIRLAEGYAHYALRPEAFGLAARKLRLSGPPQVIGLRSIGTGLACVAAAVLDAPPPQTLRPAGDTFDRTLRISEELAADLLAGEPHYIIVDEGPGLSGSSFGCVADWLEDHGVPADRIAFLPGHGGDLGPQATERHRRRWATAQRPLVNLDRPRPEWLEPLIGPLIAPLIDISGGAWRPFWSSSESSWPAIDPVWERRKFLARSKTGSWLVKWAGLGGIGESKLALAQKLGDWTSEVAGLTGGWLVTPWHEDAQPTRPTFGELTAYLRLRAKLATAVPGASLNTLLSMVRRNAPSMAEWSPDLASLQPRPVLTDNRLAAHEWLRLPTGRLLKADALDHHQGHDLIGCQDVAWDVAGAIIELDLAPEDTDQLRSDLGCSQALLDFYLIAYVALRIGAHRLSAESLDHWPEEQRRNLAAAERLEARLPAVDAIEHARHIN